MTYVFQNFLPPQGLQRSNISLPSLKTNDQCLLFSGSRLISHSTYILTTFSGPEKAFNIIISIRLHPVGQYIRQIRNSDPVNDNNYKYMASKQSILPLMNSHSLYLIDSDNKILGLAQEVLHTIQRQQWVKALITCSRPQIKSVMEQGFK